MDQRKELLKTVVEHYDIKKLDVIPMVDAMSKMAFQARNLGRASQIYDQMLKEKDCAVILCLAGSLFSAGLKKVVFDMVSNNMVDAIVSTGANIVDQDFFEGLGYKHYVGTPFIDDNMLRDNHIDRIYDTFIDEDQLRDCDMTIANICKDMDPKAYSSREFIKEMGKYLDQHGKNKESVVLACYKHEVPIFVPAFSDCSAGFGLVHHQWHSTKAQVSIDSAKDFLELTKVKLAAKETGLLMIGGGVPKNFAQDTVVAAEILGKETPMHKYAVQITVADERDGALSGSTLKEASSWGKVSTSFEQMVYGEATTLLPLLAGYAYHKKNWQSRSGFKFSKLLDQK
jgi:deoxyhypusine synthase